MMNTNELSTLLLHYGRVTTDISFEEIIHHELYVTRVRTIAYNGKHFYHLMVNGCVTECFELR